MRLTTTAAALIMLLLTACQTTRQTVSDHQQHATLQELAKWQQATTAWADINETIKAILPNFPITTSPISGIPSPESTPSDTLKLIRHAVTQTHLDNKTTAATSNINIKNDHAQVNERSETIPAKSNVRIILELAAFAILAIIVIILIHAPWRTIIRFLLKTIYDFFHFKGY